MHSLNKECLSCVPEPGVDTQDMEGSITFYEIEETDESAFSPIPVRIRSTLLTFGILRPFAPITTTILASIPVHHNILFIISALCCFKCLSFLKLSDLLFMLL